MTGKCAEIGVAEVAAIRKRKPGVWEVRMFVGEDERGRHLGEPFTRPAARKLRVLRFSRERRRFRFTYDIATGRRIVALTVFHKTRRQPRRETDPTE